MGNCVQGTKILTEEDIDFIAKNTAMDKTQVEVKQLEIESVPKHELLFAEPVPEFPKEAPRWKNLQKVFPYNDEGMLSRCLHRET